MYVRATLTLKPNARTPPPSEWSPHGINGEPNQPPTQSNASTTSPNWPSCYNNAQETQLSWATTQANSGRPCTQPAGHAPPSISCCDNWSYALKSFRCPAGEATTEGVSAILTSPENDASQPHEGWRAQWNRQAKKGFQKGSGKEGNEGIRGRGEGYWVLYCKLSWVKFCSIAWRGFRLSSLVCFPVCLPTLKPKKCSRTTFPWVPHSMLSFLTNSHPHLFKPLVRRIRCPVPKFCTLL